jgi:hypothetical protein
VVNSRRQLNLRRWVRGQEFIDLHERVAGWLDRHLAIMESGAPWLTRIGVDVYEICYGAVRPRFEFSLESGPRASVSCVREVIAVYGFNGLPASRLGHLEYALSVAGWLRSGAGPWVGSRGNAVLRWEPSDELDYPPGMAGVPPLGRPALAPAMWLSWGSRGQPARLRPNPARKRGDDRNYLTIESSGVEYWKFPEVALSDHEHVIAANLNLSYYSNPTPLEPQHRIPRYFLPTPMTR